MSGSRKSCKAIAAYGAHNQRGEVTVQIRSRKAVWIEDVIAIIESSGSSELYALLKRQDEKAVTERVYIGERLKGLRLGCLKAKRVLLTVLRLVLRVLWS